MKFVFYENGDIMTWGEGVIGGVELVLPDDWSQFGVQKYVANADRTALVARPGWTDPTPEPAVEPEA